MANDKSILFFLGEEEIKTMVSALMKAYSTADMNARYANGELDKKREEVEALTAKLGEATCRMVQLDTAYNDMDEERAEWKAKYEKLYANVGKLAEKEGK